MPSTVSNEEIEILKKHLIGIQNRVKGNKEEAIKVLQDVGILDKKGKLTAPYRIDK
jgi:hypothetical protein